MIGNIRASVRTLVGATFMAAFAATSSAQSLSSFNLTALFSDVSITTSDQLTYTVAVGANPSFVYGNTTYQITDVIGFWVLSDSADLAASNIDFTSGVGNWTEKNNNAGTGGIAGWRASNANVGLTPGETETFTFLTLAQSSDIDGYGLHVRVAGTFPNSGGNTGHARVQTVPEPASLAAIGIGLGALLRRRARRSV